MKHWYVPSQMKATPSPPEAEVSSDLWPVPIGTAARLTGLSAKMVRHYEALGLLPEVARTDSGYRQYSQADVHSLHFIQRARALGFSIADIGELLALWQDRHRNSAGVKRIAQKHLDELGRRMAALQAMQRALTPLLHHCHGDEHPDCPILDDLAGMPADAQACKTRARLTPSPRT